MRLVLIFLAALATPVLALPPDSVYPDNAEHLWWECHVQPATKIICCRESDGHVLGDDEWRTIEKPEGALYQVHVGGKWYDVPANAVVNDFGHCGPEPNMVHRAMAKVWYAPTWDLNNEIVNIRIYCFISGTMY
jgi:hypothetical protein